MCVCVPLTFLDHFIDNHKNCMTVTELEEIHKTHFAITWNQEKEYGDLKISEVVQKCCYV